MDYEKVKTRGKEIYAKNVYENMSCLGKYKKEYYF